MFVFRFSPLARIGISALLLTMLIISGVYHVSVVKAEEFPSETFGGQGGTSSYNLDCGSNGTIVGVMVKAHVARIDQLAVICRTINVQTGALGNEYTRGPVGGFDGRDFSKRCQEETVATRMQAVHGQFVDGFILGCDRWSASNRQIQQGAEADNQHIIGIPFGVNPFVGGNVSQQFVCPGFRLAKALRGRVGIYIDSLQMVCDDWDK